MRFRLVVREGDRDVEETRRTGEAGEVALEVNEAEAPVLLPVAFRPSKTLRPRTTASAET
jgi:hypothetical protein